MPIQLSVPFNPGDLDPGKTYPQAKIKNINIDLDSKAIIISWTYGEEINNVWAVGSASKPKEVWIRGDDYNTIIMSLISESDNDIIYEGIKRVLYQYLINNNYLTGSIV